MTAHRATAYIFDDCTAEEAMDYCTKNGINPEGALIADHSPSCGEEYLKALPLLPKPKGMIGPMFGGNYAYAYEREFPRYSTLPNRSVPIPIHDRFETPEEYETLSM